MIVVYEEWYNGAMSTEHGRKNSVKGQWREITPEYMTYAIGMLLDLLGPGKAYLQLNGVLYEPAKFRDAPRRNPAKQLQYATNLLRELGLWPESEQDDFEPLTFGL